MASEVQDPSKNCFLDTAISQGLLRESHADRVSTYATERSLTPSDAALELAVLQAYEVEAVRMLCAPGELAPGYHLSSLIGCGAAGMVFRARQERLGRDVALKTINPQSGTAKTTGEPRIQREAHAIARLRHPGIVAAYDSGLHRGRFYIAMELVEGETLTEFIQQQGRINEITTWRICRQVANALAHASAEGIIHRDIKPANLLLCDPPTGMELPAGVPWVKVADFGLAFDDSSNQITATGASLGTPAYVAPEQLQDSQVGVQADIYALGATVFHMLSGKPPCIGQSPMKTIMQKSVGDQRWREELKPLASEQSLELFREMTESDTSHRIPDYKTLIARIDNLIGDLVEDRAQTADSSYRLRSSLAILESFGASHVIAVLILVSVAFLATAGLYKAAVVDRVNIEPQEVSQVDLDDWTVAGVPQPLFNGRSVPSFRKSGTWVPRKASDGSRVLGGLQGAQMTIPLSGFSGVGSDLRLRMNVSPSADSRIQIELKASDKGPGFGTLTIAEGFAEFIPAEFTASNSPVSNPPVAAKVPLLPAGPEGLVFYQLSAVHADGQVAIVVDGNMLVLVPETGSVDPQLTITCSAGSTNFADIDVVGLKPVS